MKRHSHTNRIPHCKLAELLFSKSTAGKDIVNAKALGKFMQFWNQIKNVWIQISIQRAKLAIQKKRKTLTKNRLVTAPHLL